MASRIGVVICGIKFGGAFVPIYRDHPDVKFIGLYDPNRQDMEETAAHFGITRLYDSFEDVLNDPEVDAVHVVSPIPAHEEQSVRVLRSGKHCACTVPMSMTLDILMSSRQLIYL